MSKKPATATAPQTVAFDADSVWNELIKKRHDRGDWETVTAIGPALGVLALHKRDDRTRARLTATDHVPALLLVEFYRHMSWGQEVSFRIDQAVVKELIDGAYVDAVVQHGVIFPYIEKPQVRQYEINRAGRERLQDLRIEQAKAAP